MKINKESRIRLSRKNQGIHSVKGRILLAAIIILIIFVVFGLDFRLLIRHYEIDSEGKLDSPIRIALITDLHSCRYGEEMQELIHAVESQSPDVLMLCGGYF